jgi:Tfp pilus assembly protein PilX
MRLLARIRSDESGVALVVAMGSLLVVGLLAFALADGASSVSRSTFDDGARSRALATAQAGVNIANHRLGKADPRPLDTQCFTTAPVNPTGGVCPWTTPESLGNRATVTYRISPILSAGTDTCATQPTSIPYSWKQRCITAEATVDGETRIVQRRIVQNFGGTPFPFLGALGLSGISINQSRLQGTVGSNVNVQIGPGSTITNPGDVKLGQRGGVPGTLTLAGGSYSGTLETNLPEFTLDPLDQLYSDAVSPNNDNPASSPGISLVNGNLTLGPSRTLWLQSGGVYSFCSITMNSGARMRLAASATEPAKVFVDSWHRPGNPDYTPSTCARRMSGGDVVSMASGAGFVNDTNRASMLQVYVYGGSSAADPNYNIMFNSSADFTGTLYAPRSQVTFASGGNLTGAMAVDRIVFNNNNSAGNYGYRPDPDAMNTTGVWDGTYLRKGWRECPPAGCT